MQQASDKRVLDSCIIWHAGETGPAAQQDAVAAYKLPDFAREPHRLRISLNDRDCEIEARAFGRAVNFQSERSDVAHDLTARLGIQTR